MITFYKSYSIAWLLLVSLLVTQVFAGTGPSQEVKLAASNGGAYGNFGDVVSLSNNIALIGAKGFSSGSGIAYIFRSGDGGSTWNQQQNLTASNSSANDKFAYSVSVYNDIALIGAYGDDNERGKAYIFRSSDGGVTWPEFETVTLTATARAQYDMFGYSVSIFGSVAVIGASGEDFYQGSVYIFRSSDGGVSWPTSETTKLTASDGSSPDRFGDSVSIYGDIILVGAPLSDSYKGSAYIFRSGNGGASWPTSQTAKLTASDASESSGFGHSVSVFGDVVVVGANGGNEARGSAYIFRSSNGGVSWPASETTKLTASDAGDTDNFGISVSIFNQTILIGASGEDSTSRGSGSAYLFRSTDEGVTWPASETAKLTVPGLKKNSGFGYSLSVNNAYALIGAPGYYPGGRTYVISTTCGNGVLETMEHCDDANAISGDGCSTLCGIEEGWTCNGAPSVCHTTCGDGIVAGNETCDDGNSNSADGCSSACSIEIDWSCNGSPSICRSHDPWKLTPPGNYPFQSFGQSLNIYENVTIIGAPYDDASRGSAYIYKRSNTRVLFSSATSIKLIPSNRAEGARFGESVSVFGNVAVVGAPGDDGYKGSAYIFQSSDGGVAWPASETTKLTVSASYSAFGMSVSIYNHVVLIGASEEEYGKGSAYVFRSSDEGVTWSQMAKLTAADAADFANFGNSVSIFSNIALIAAYGDANQRGSAYIFRSTNGGVTWSQAAKMTPSNGSEYDRFGSSVSIYNNIALIGASEDDSYRGRVYVFRSSDGGSTWPASETASLTAFNRMPNEYFGDSVSIYNNTALVGARGDDSRRGSAYIFRSSDGGVTWPASRAAKLTAPDSSPDEKFGSSVSIYGIYALIGAPEDNPSGSAYVFSTACSDGVLQANESCDDGNFISGDGCSSTCGVESGWFCSGAPSLCSAICGDGIVAGPETCEDGNANNNDGCNSTCGVELGWNCSGTPSICSVECADGIVAGSESCDDGNKVNNDGCNSTCGVEFGWYCSENPSICSTVCGDGIIAGTEQCDDENNNSTDGCNSTCGVEFGWTCNDAPSVCNTTCGDGIAAGSEICDDDNLISNDGCSSICGIEMGWYCSGTPSICSTVCGDGIIASAEQCDDENNNSTDGCSSTCGVESGWTCSGTPSNCSAICGDGIVVGPETCDDGNNSTTDGCNSTCRVEFGWTCTGAPSQCDGICGDGMLKGSELCDDGNKNSTDGCSSTCGVESGWTCSGAPSVCNTTCGDGIVTGKELCDDGGVIDSDGCNSTCGIEMRWRCNGMPSKCDGICGDGYIIGSETCDDNNLFQRDGCSSTCIVEKGWSCTGEPSFCLKSVVPSSTSTATEGDAAGLC
jgi:cysteine-rich repeat protein